MCIHNVCERSLLYDSIFSIFLLSCVTHNGSRFLSKIMENSVRDISSCRKPTGAVLSRIVDLNALYQHLVPPCHFRFRFCRYGVPKVFDPKYLAIPWEFPPKNFTALYLFPTSTNFPFLNHLKLPVWGQSPLPQLFYCVLLVVKLLIRPTSFKFVHLALRSIKVGKPWYKCISAFYLFILSHNVNVKLILLPTCSYVYANRCTR